MPGARAKLRTVMHEMDRPAVSPLPSRAQARLRTLLAMRVSEVLDAVPGALEMLQEHGFEPLAQPAMRRVLAPTVTLDQAIRLRGLPAWRREALLVRLAELDAVARPEAAACR